MATLEQLYGHFKTLTSQWHYLKSEVDTALNGKVDKVNGKGLSANDFTNSYKDKLDGIETGATNVTVDSALSDSSTNPVQNKIVKGGLDGKVDKVSGKGLSANDFTSAYKDKLDGIEAQANKTVVDSALSSSSTNPVENNVINTALSTLSGRIDTLESFDLVEFTTDKGNPSEDKMGKLWVETKNSKTDVYVVKASGTDPNITYDWESLDTDILDSLVVNWSDIQSKPNFGTGASDFAYGNHTHGNISNTGTCTTDVSFSSKMLITNSSDVIGTATAVDVIDNVVNQLISYGE